MSAKHRFIIDTAQAAVRRFFQRFGYEIVKMGGDYTPDELVIMAKVRPFTATSNERISGLINAVKYLSRNRIEGDFVECGVWRGGSIMAAMLALLQLGDISRNFYLYDTYEGMTPPTDKDVTYGNDRAVDLLAASEADKEGPSYWCVAGLDDVKRNVFSTGYPKDKIHFVKGRVEDTLPASLPGKIALLRLDTDWYESTYHDVTAKKESKGLADGPKRVVFGAVRRKPNRVCQPLQRGCNPPADHPAHGRAMVKLPLS